MKKFDGMMPPTLVFADEGKNGDFGPPPSSCMEAGTTSGLTMRSLGLGFALRQSRAAAGRATSSTAATTNACRNRAQPGLASPAAAFRRQSQIPKAMTPSPAATTWAQRTGRWARTLPAMLSQSPAASAIRKRTPAGTRPGRSSGLLASSTAKATARTTPSTRWISTFDI